MQMAASLADRPRRCSWTRVVFEFQRVPLPAAADLVVIHSGVNAWHSGVATTNTRRAECEEAATQLGVAQLRDLTRADLPRIAQLAEPLGRRARHVLTEDERVLDSSRHSANRI